MAEVSLDGGETGWFLLDTGFGCSAVAPDFARASKTPLARLRDGGSAAAASGDEVELTAAARCSALATGSARFLGLDLPLVDLSAISAAHGGDVRGVLGFSTFASVLLTIDYPGTTVRVEPGALGPADGEEVLAYELDQGSPFVTLDVGGHPLRFLIDSGSNESLALPAGTAEGLEWAYGPVPFARAASAGGVSERIRFGRLAGDVRIGRHGLRRPIVGLSAAYGRIGGDVLEHFRVTFDGKQRLARFQSESAEPIEFPSWRGHGAGFAAAEGGEVLADVVPGSPAEKAGLREGDRVVFRRKGAFEEPGACGQPHSLPADFVGEFLCVRRGDAYEHFALPEVDLLP